MRRDEPVHVAMMAPLDWYKSVSPEAAPSSDQRGVGGPGGGSLPCDYHLRSQPAPPHPPPERSHSCRPASHPEQDGATSRADCDGIAYEIPADLSEIPGISVWDAPSTDAM